MMTDRDAKEVLEVLSNKHRLSILMRLRQQSELGSSDLSDGTLSAQAMSYHLRLMIEKGLVTRRSKNNRPIYTLDTDRLAELGKWLSTPRSPSLPAFNAEGPETSIANVSASKAPS